MPDHFFERAVSAKSLDAMIVEICYVYEAIAVDSESSRGVEFRGARARTTELEQELALGRELLNPVVVVVRDVHRAITPHRHAHGVAEFARVRCLHVPPLPEDFALGAKTERRAATRPVTYT